MSATLDQGKLLRVQAQLAMSCTIVTKEEVGKALKCVKIGKGAGDDGVTLELLKDRGDIVLKKLAVLFSEF